jgi:hypothetical protein
MDAPCLGLVALTEYATSPQHGAFIFRFLNAGCQYIKICKDFVFSTMWFQKRLCMYFRVLLGLETSP